MSRKEVKELRVFVESLFVPKDVEPLYNIAAKTVELWLSLSFHFLKGVIADIQVMLNRDKKINSHYVNDVRDFYQINMLNIETAMDANVISSSLKDFRDRSHLYEGFGEKVWKAVAVTGVLTGAIIGISNVLGLIGNALAQRQQVIKFKREVKTNDYMHEFYYDSVYPFLSKTLEGILKRSIRDHSQLVKTFTDYVHSLKKDYPEIYKEMTVWNHGVPRSY